MPYELTPQDTTPIFEKLQHPTIHVVKSWTRYFNAMQDGTKKFDRRVWDRDYQVGDTLIQEEWNKDGGYTGKSVGHVITYILTGEFAEPGICVMSVDGVEFETRKEWGEKIRQDEREKVLDDLEHYIQYETPLEQFSKYCLAYTDVLQKVKNLRKKDGE